MLPPAEAGAEVALPDVPSAFEEEDPAVEPEDVEEPLPDDVGVVEALWVEPLGEVLPPVGDGVETVLPDGLFEVV